MTSEAPTISFCPHCGLVHGEDVTRCPSTGRLVQLLSEDGCTFRDPMPRAGALVGRKYELLEEIGAGSMGVVFRARHVQLGHAVALKVMASARAHDPTLRQRLLREARAIGRVRSAHVVELLDVGVLSSGLVYVVMELLDGQTLREAMEAEGLDMEDAVEITLQLLSALSAAHEAGIVHRDVKPGNIMLHQGPEGVVVKLVDFGISHVRGDRPLTGVGQIIGTPHYVAPEQAAGETIDARCDVWAAGVVLYEMLTGQVPFGGEDPVEIVENVLSTVPWPPSTFRSELPASVDRVVLRALARRKRDRHQSARELAVELGCTWLDVTPTRQTHRYDERSTAA